MKKKTLAIFLTLILALAMAMAPTAYAEASNSLTGSALIAFEDDDSVLPEKPIIVDPDPDDPDPDVDPDYPDIGPLPKELYDFRNRDLDFGLQKTNSTNDTWYNSENTVGAIVYGVVGYDWELSVAIEDFEITANDGSDPISVGDPTLMGFHLQLNTHETSTGTDVGVAIPTAHNTVVIDADSGESSVALVGGGAGLAAGSWSGRLHVLKGTAIAETEAQANMIWSLDATAVTP